MCSCERSDVAIHLKCIEMGSNILCVLKISNAPMSCGRCLRPCTSSITKKVECGTRSQEMYKIKYVADRHFFVFLPLFSRNEICICDKKKKLHGKSSLYEGLKVKSVFVLISFSSISIH